jgi:TPR repeat protein
MPQNFAKALAWTRSAAESGHARAQLALARMYQEGWPGLAPDPLRAYMWASLAAAAGEPQAATLRDRLRLSLRPAELAEAQKLAVGWRPAAK